MSSLSLSPPTTWSAELSHVASEETMNAFEFVIRDAVNVAATSEADALFGALLAYASTDVEGADTYANPTREVLHRLAARGVGDIALGYVRQRLNTLLDKGA